MESSEVSKTSSITSATNVSKRTTVTTFCLVQLYVPPDSMITKDWLKLVFAGKKRLLELNEVSRINMPSYDELSVSNLWDEASKDPEFM